MKLTLTAKTPVTQDVTSFIWEPENLVEWKPGQYFHYNLEHENPDDRGTERYFTISAAPFEQHLQVTTRFAGEDKSSSFKKAMFNMNIGDQIEGDGPEGDFIVEDFSKNYVFIAGGIGITPFRSMFAQFKHNNQQLNCDLLYANRDEIFIFEDEINEFAQTQQNFKMTKFVDPKKIEADDIKNLFPELNSQIYYISGPKPMVFHYKDLLTKIGVEEGNIKLDDFPGYEII